MSEIREEQSSSTQKDSHAPCTLCPHDCGVDRAAGQKGRCHVDDRICAARAALHMWEEQCLSGRAGSGAVFFSGCALGCIFCQNREIASGKAGLTISEERLSEIFLELQEKGANNINLVTAGHYVPQVIRSLDRAKSQGLRIPVVYNSSGYEKVEILRQMEGMIDIYLPDLKYLTPELAAAYSHAPDYPQCAMEAIAEMVRQQPRVAFAPEGNIGSQKLCSAKREDMIPKGTEKSLKATSDEKEVNQHREHEVTEGNQIMQRGVIVRHLLLPGHVREAKKVVSYLHETYGDQIYISMMNQYTPMSEKFADPNLNRRVTKREYGRLLDYAAEIGVENGFYQEGATADESFIPAFNYEGVRRRGLKNTVCQFFYTRQCPPSLK